MSKVVKAPAVTDEFFQCWLQVNNLTLDDLPVKTQGKQTIVQKSELLEAVQREFWNFTQSSKSLQQYFNRVLVEAKESNNKKLIYVITKQITGSSCKIVSKELFCYVTFYDRKIAYFTTLSQVYRSF